MGLLYLGDQVTRRVYSPALPNIRSRLPRGRGGVPTAPQVHVRVRAEGRAAGQKLPVHTFRM